MIFRRIALSEKDSFDSFYIQITFDNVIEVYHFNWIYLLVYKKQLHISYGTTLVCEKIFMVRNSPTYTQISSLL